MHRRAARIGIAMLAVACAPRFLHAQAGAQLKVPPEYTAEAYVTGLANPCAIAVSPGGAFGPKGELFVSHGHAEGVIVRVPGKGKVVPFAKCADHHSSYLAFAPEGSGFPPCLFSTENEGPGSQINCIAWYDARGRRTTLTCLGQMEQMTIAFAPGGKWGRDLYVVDSWGLDGDKESVRVVTPRGEISYLVSGMPENLKGMAFGPGGRWGDHLYLSFGDWAGEVGAVRRVDANGNVTDFVTGREKLGTGMLVALAFDTVGRFRRHLFVSSAGDNCLFEIDPDGNVSTFATGFDFEGLNTGSISCGDIVFAPDGAMFVADSGRGVIWRITRNRMGLWRDPSADTLVTADGEVLHGALSVEDLVLRTARGDVKLEAGRLVGLAATDGGDLRCLLADGQIVRGRPAGGGVRITPPGKEALHVPWSGLRQCSRRISDSHPGTFDLAGRLVATRDGEELFFESGGLALDFRTPWGRVRLDPNEVLEVASVDGDSPRPFAAPATMPVVRSGPSADDANSRPTHRVRFRNGTVLHGRLEGDRILLALSLGGRMEKPPGEVTRLCFARDSQPAPWLTRLQLADGDVLVGRMALKTLQFRTDSGVRETATNEVEQVSVDRATGRAVVRTWDGQELRARWETASIAFQIGAAAEVAVPAGSVVSLVNTTQVPPEEFARKVAELVGKLGADAFREREAATTQLVRMGPAVVPLLEPHREHADAEVRERIRFILETLAPQSRPPEPRSIAPGLPGVMPGVMQRNK